MCQGEKELARLPGAIWSHMVGSGRSRCRDQAPSPPPPLGDRCQRENTRGAQDVLWQSPPLCWPDCVLSTGKAQITYNPDPQGERGMTNADKVGRVLPWRSVSCVPLGKLLSLSVPPFSHQ